MSNFDLRAALVDVDGTLLDSNDAHARAWIEALHRSGYDVPYEKVRPLIGKGGDKLLKEVADLDDQTGEGKKITDERKDRFRRDYLPQLEATRGARELLQGLRARGVLVVVATSAGGDELAGLLKQAKVEDLVDTASTSSDAQDSKPDPDIVVSALRKAGVRADQAVMIGDTPHDVAAALGAGVASIALRCGGWWTDDSLSKAMAIYDDPFDLLQHLDQVPGLHIRGSSTRPLFEK